MAEPLLLHATGQGDAEQVAALLVEGLADCDATNEIGDTPLHFATGRGLLDIMELLLSYGANPNAAEKAEFGGATPLHIAARANDLKAAETLLNHRANPNVQDSLGFTPLHVCARLGHLEMAQLLISKGCALDIKDSRGKTPYVHAQDCLHTQVADLLPATTYDWLKEASANVRFVEVAATKPVVKKKGKKGKRKGKKAKRR